MESYTAHILTLRNSLKGTGVLYSLCPGILWYDLIMAPFTSKQYLSWINKKLTEFSGILIIGILLFLFPDLLEDMVPLAEYWAPYVAPFSVYFAWKNYSEQFKHAMASRLLDAGVKNEMAVSSNKIKEISLWIYILVALFLLAAILDNRTLLFLSTGACLIQVRSPTPFTARQWG